MKFLLISFIVIFGHNFAIATVLNGNVSGVLEPMVYHVPDDMRVPAGDTLIAKEGVALYAYNGTTIIIDGVFICHKGLFDVYKRTQNDFYEWYGISSGYCSVTKG